MLYPHSNHRDIHLQEQISAFHPVAQMDHIAPREFQWGRRHNPIGPNRLSQYLFYHLTYSPIQFGH